MLKTEQVVNKIIEALEDNKAHRIVKIDLRKIENCFCSFFVICHGTSGTHIAGLTDAVEEKVREDLDERPFHIEGLNAAQWVVVDYGDIVVHIFEKELRDYYQLEDFWADAQITEIAGEPEMLTYSVIIRQTEQIENSKEYKYCEHTKWQTTTKTRKTEDSIFLQ